MATDLTRGDIVAIVAYGSKDGDQRVVYRYRDGTTKTFVNGVFSEAGVASDTATWWRE